MPACSESTGETSLVMSQTPVVALAHNSISLSSALMQVEPTYSTDVPPTADPAQHIILFGICDT